MSKFANTNSADDIGSLNFEDMVKALNAMPQRRTEIMYGEGDQFTMNYLERKFGERNKEVEPSQVGYIGRMYGIPLHSRAYVPQGELWFYDENGKKTVVKVF